MRSPLNRCLSAAALTALFAACAPNDPDNAPSPVQTVSRSTERVGAGNQAMNSYDRRGEDGTVVGKVLAPAPQVWEALKGAFEARNVKLSIFDRAAGRIGDTAMVFTHRWAGQSGSYYFSCGQVMTGQRADEDRLKAVVLTQMARGTADTILLSVHMSAFATPISMGSSAAVAQCSSTGRGETDLIDDVYRRLGVRR
jgi:hypothetical protein